MAPQTGAMRVSARNCLKSLDRAKTEPYEQTKRAEEAPILACCANECALETPSELLFRQFPMNVLGNPESMRRAGALRPRSVLAGSYLSLARHRVAERVVLRPFLLAFHPLRVVLNPRVVAFRRNAELHQVALGAHPEHTHLPILCLLWRCSPFANSLSCWPASVLATLSSAFSKGSLVWATIAFACLERTSSAISATVCSGLMVLSSFPA